VKLTDGVFIVAVKTVTI